MAIRNRSVNLGATEGHRADESPCQEALSRVSCVNSWLGSPGCPGGCFLNGCAGRGHSITGHSRVMFAAWRWPGQVTVSLVESRPGCSETLACPFLPGPKPVERSVMGEISHLPPLSGYTEPCPDQLHGGVCTHIHIHTHTYTRTHILIHILTCTHTLMHIHPHSHKYIQLHTHTHTLLYTHPHAETHNTHTFNLLQEMQPPSPLHSFAHPLCTPFSNPPSSLRSLTPDWRPPLTLHI